MELLLYERPRERLREKGARSLSMAELLQVVIGSGTNSLPVSRVARSVATYLEGSYGQGSDPAYDDLVKVAGIGDAKACQLLASIELGRRARNGVAVRQSVDYAKVVRPVGSMRKVTILCVTFSGSAEVIKTRTFKYSSSDHFSLTAKRLVRTALSDNAVSIAVGIGCASQSPDATMTDLALAKAINESAHAVGIRLVYFGLVNKQASFEVSLATTTNSGRSQ